MEDRRRRRPEIRASAAQGLDWRAIGAVWAGARRGLRRVRARSFVRDDRSRQSLLGRRPAAGYRIHLQSVRERAGVGERRALGLVGEGTGARAVRRQLRQPLPHQSRSGRAGVEPRVRRDRRLRRRRPQGHRRNAASSRSRNALRRMVDTEDVRFVLTTGDNIYARVARSSASPSAAPATKTTTGSSPTSSRIAT